MSTDQITTVDQQSSAVKAVETEFVGGRHRPVHHVRDGGSETLGAKADAPATSDDGAFTAMALLKRLFTKLPSSIGQKAASNSLSVTLATGTVVPVSAEALPLPAGAATEAKQDAGNTTLAAVQSGIGAQADTAAINQTGSWSLVALAKGTLGTLLAMLGRLPVLGAGTVAQSTPVNIASDQGAVPVKGSALAITDASGTITAAGTAQEVLAVNVTRRYLHIANPDRSRTLYFSTTGSAAVAGAGSTALGPGAWAVWDVAIPNGAVSVAANGAGQPFTVKQG